MGGRGKGSGMPAVTGKTHLQGIGDVPAVKAGTITKGMTLRWNYGYESKVLSVKPSSSGKSVTVKLQGYDDKGRKTSIGERTLRSDRLVGVKVG
jgi:hypothetical protein